MNAELMIEILKDAEQVYLRWAEGGGLSCKYTRIECLRRADACKLEREHLQGACV